MTNRRRSGKGKTSVAKKSESPDKQAKKLNRRGRRSKKSESPERPDEPGSDFSGDETEDRCNKKVDGNQENESFKEENQFEGAKNNEDQKTALKEEESGGSDGSWKVKSENGGGGGIPKLKLCLTRPPEMSSPTSTTDQNPSPRRKRRSGRGNITPTKDDEQVEENSNEECSKRVTRNQKAKEIQELGTTRVFEQEEQETEVCHDGKPQTEVEPENEQESELKAESEVQQEQQQYSHEREYDGEEEEKKKEGEEVAVKTCNLTNITPNEEDETQIAVESICMPKPSQLNMVECTQIQDSLSVFEEREMRKEEEEERENKPEYEVKVETQAESPTNSNLVTCIEAIPIPPDDKLEESEKKENVEVENLKAEKKTEDKEEENAMEESKEKAAQFQSDHKAENEPEENAIEESKEKAQIQADYKVDNDREDKVEEESQVDKEVEFVADKRRSSSRDSSEERAKEAALRSRNKNKRKEGSEEGEVVESPRDENIRSTRLQDKTKKSSLATTATSEIERKESAEEAVPAKSGARKRRWGSSTSRTSKKPTVSISTDVLKEIIPEVKPLLMSEVQLSPNEEDEEGQLKDSEENLPVISKKAEREKMIQSDESEKDYEEEAVESGLEEPSQTETKQTIQVKEKEFTTFTRKVSVMSTNEKLQKSPSPPRNKPSNILYIVNLVRPFTIPQLRELLARTGTIVEDGFWIDKIKSKCYVKYETEEEAKTTRHALHGVTWPVSNPKQLNVDFGSEAAMKAAMEGNDVPPKRPIPSLFDKPIELKTNEKPREREKEKEKGGDRRDRSEKEKKERGKHKSEDKREEDEDKEKKSRLAEPPSRERTVRRVTMPVREWDVGKNEDGFSPPPDGIEYSRHRDDRYERRVEYDREKRDDYDERRRRDKERSRRSASAEPPRKSKKKSDEEAPAKLLDDLFRKTKATPCIYWLPLTPEQISVKEEMRRKHMAEHEKKVAELRKMQREQSKRGSEKRRRRSRSRSRSRSAKK